MNKELLKEGLKTIRLYGDDWLDENDCKYKWIEDSKMFFNVDDYKYYTTVDRLAENKIVVKPATATIIDEMYVDGYDKTVLTERVIIDGDVKSEEIVSWYFGPPSKQTTYDFNKNRRLKAEYDVADDDQLDGHVIAATKLKAMRDMLLQTDGNMLLTLTDEHFNKTDVLLFFADSIGEFYTCLEAMERLHRSEACHESIINHFLK